MEKLESRDHFLSTLHPPHPHCTLCTHPVTRLCVSHIFNTKTLSMKYAPQKDKLLLFNISFSARNYLKHVFSRALFSLLSRHYLSITHSLSQLLKTNPSWYLVVWKQLTALAISSYHFQTEMSQHGNKHGTPKA